MALTNGHPKEFKPKTMQDVWATEQKNLKVIISSLSEQHSSLALSALNEYMMDKIDSQRHVDSEVFSRWDQVLWYVEDISEDDLPPNIKQQARCVLLAKNADYLGELVILSNSLMEWLGNSHKLESLMHDYVFELDCLRRNLNAWMNNNMSPIPYDIHFEKLCEALRSLDSLIRLVETGITSLFHNGWLCSSNEQRFLTQLYDDQLVFPEYE
ncbi:hypothetical protein FHS15_002863 [Paenibacillus castaneae]|uniref:hypothetical protein n=1 Tax=Paenibacillus castaneae TaxID=474957 RepID=UPI000C9B97E5|nr:hypothetical protein [Paenibacillus castaneae]NIK77725.1 hypothetical protein [Paenibacillus castaneae]